MSADLLALWVPGKPETEHRGRAAKRADGSLYVFKDRRTEAWKARATALITHAWGRQPQIAEPVEVAICCYVAPPKCRAGRGMAVCAQKPDIDNLTKPALDAITGSKIWLDDRLAVRVDARKWEIPSLPGGEPCGESGMSIVIRRAKSWAELGGDPLWEASTSPEIPRRARA